MNNKRVKVLIVESTHSVLMYEEMLFQRTEECEICSVATGGEAIRIHMQTPQNIIVMSDFLEDMNAAELHRRLRERNQGMPLECIITTANNCAHPNQSHELPKPHPHTHVRPKPLQSNDIRNILKTALATVERNEHGRKRKVPNSYCR